MLLRFDAVSYTHLDVYKRQGLVNYGKSNIGYILLLDLALVIFSITFGGAFCVLLKSEDIATKILNLVINVFAILSGLFFPMYIFGKKIANLSTLSPISKVMSTFFSIIYDKNYGSYFNTLVILLLCSALFLIIIHFKYRPENYGE